MKSVKDELTKRLRLCREPLEAGKLFVVRSQQEQEKVTEFAMNLKKLFKQAYPEESSASGILLQRFLMGLKTSISRQLLLRGKPDTLKKAIVTAMEIESVFALESNTAENVKPVSMVQEWADRDTGLQVALKELTERLGNLETKIQSVAQCSGAPETSS